jgi:hypothetical protein
VEISPACDVAQGKRVCALLIAGLIVPTALEKQKKKADFLFVSPPFRVRWSVEGFEEQDAILLLCHNYKTSIPHLKTKRWIEPWFRLRDLPITSIRNANTAHAARVGYISIR